MKTISPRSNHVCRSKNEAAEARYATWNELSELGCYSIAVVYYRNVQYVRQQGLPFGFVFIAMTASIVGEAPPKIDAIRSHIGHIYLA